MQSILLFFLGFITLSALGNIAVGQISDCLKTNGQGLPNFQGYAHCGSCPGRPNRRIHHRNQAIIPSYKFNCCGSITEWGVDLNPNGADSNFTFILQIWRPSPHVDDTGCYSLVDDFISTSLSVNSNGPGVAVVSTSSAAQELQFQVGDVLGFYVESHSGTSDHDNGVVVLQYQNWRSNSNSYSESVWYGSIDATARTSQSGSCPYTVGSSGVLKSLTHGAPVISIATTTYPCHQTFPTLVNYVPSSIIPHSMDPTLPSAMSLRVLSSSAPTSVASSSMPRQTLAPTTSSHSGLISGVLVTVIFVFISTIVIITATIIIKQRSKKTLHVATGITLSNQIYGTPETDNISKTYEYPDSSPDIKGIEATYTEAVPYHSMGPDASRIRSSHVYVGDPLRNGACKHDTTSYKLEGMDTECCVYENPDTKEAVVYETPVDGLFDTSGLHVPTADERLGDDYGTQNFNKHVYSKLEFFVEDQIYWAPASTTSDLYSQLASKKYREIPRKQIKILKALGSGEFGNVYKAVWSISGSTKEVAVKTLKPGSSENDRVRFLQEAAIMGQFNHPHVVKLYGVVTVGDPIMICIELMANGDLRGYLETVNSNEHLELQLLRFSRQIASGMAYLSKKAFVHRDLAARNILLDGTLTCKISDFGMARDLDDDTYYTVQSKGGKIPVKWTAPEALFYKKYSTDSDVWSYGMVLFEIWSVGKKPFSQITNKEVLKKINSGYCQPPPPGTPRPLYQLMVDCWNPTHSQRPPFSKISATLNASSNTLLQWTGDDRSVAGQLGGQLSEAAYLYQDLQNTYIKTSS